MWPVVERLLELLLGGTGRTVGVPVAVGAFLAGVLFLRANGVGMTLGYLSAAGLVGLAVGSLAGGAAALLGARSRRGR